MFKIGLIGTGGISGAHLNYLKTRADVEITALCDINPDALNGKVDEFGGKPYPDFRAMLSENALDAVWICTPPSVRRDPLLACAERGIPVFCEKPAERSVEMADRINDDLERLNAHVQIGYVFRATPLVQAIRKAILDDNIRLVQSFYGAPVSRSMDLPKWFYDQAQSGGALVDQATHNLDLLRYIFGEIRHVRGTAANPGHPKEQGYTIDESIAITLHFTNDLIGAHVHTWLGDSWRNEMVFIGEKRVYRINLMKGVMAIDDTKLTLDINKGKPVEKGDATGSNNVEMDMNRFYHYQNERFLAMVTSGDWSECPSDYADAVKTLKTTIACVKSLTSGGETIPI